MNGVKRVQDASLERLVLCALLKGEVCVFWTLSLIIRIIMIIYDVLQHYYDESCSEESWSSLLTSPLAENSGGEGAFQVL